MADSPVKMTELQTLSGIDITRSIQDQIDNIAVGDIVLADGKMLVGNASGDATAVTPSGGWTITNAGVSTLGGQWGYSTTATAAGTTTLTVTSNLLQFFTGSTTQTVTLPVTSTLSLGKTFIVANASTGAVTVNSSGGNAVAVVSPGTTVQFVCILTSGTTASSWNTIHSNAQITSKLLTGFSSGAGTVAATDTILQAFNKLVGNTQNLTVLANVLTGFSSGAGVVAATDTILQAINKLDGNIAAIGDGIVGEVSRTNTSLQGCITFATQVRNYMVNHAASTTGAGAHPTPDTVSFASLPAAPTDLATLKTYIKALLDAYAAHDLDAKAGTPTYHAAQYAGSDLTSVATPTTLAECLTRILDLQVKFTAHDGDDTAHTEDDLFAITSESPYVYTVQAADYLVEVSDTTGPWTITIPTALLADGKIINFKDASGAANLNNITIATQGAEDIDGADTNVINTAYGKVSIYSDGTNWFTI